MRQNLWKENGKPQVEHVLGYVHEDHHFSFASVVLSIYLGTRGVHPPTIGASSSSSIKPAFGLAGSFSGVSSNKLAALLIGALLADIDAFGAVERSGAIGVAPFETIDLELELGEKFDPPTGTRHIGGRDVEDGVIV
jgi:hypothetical protein